MDTNTGLFFRFRMCWEEWCILTTDMRLLGMMTMMTLCALDHFKRCHESYCMNCMSLLSLKASSGEMTLYVNKHCLETTHCLSLRSLELFQGQDGLNHDGWNDDHVGEKSGRFGFAIQPECGSKFENLTNQCWGHTMRSGQNDGPVAFCGSIYLQMLWPAFSFQQILEWMLRKD